MIGNIGAVLQQSSDKFEEIHKFLEKEIEDEDT